MWEPPPPLWLPPSPVDSSPPLSHRLESARPWISIQCIFLAGRTWFRSIWSSTPQRPSPLLDFVDGAFDASDQGKSRMVSMEIVRRDKDQGTIAGADT
ncbi:hypothetical protein V6N11_077928 [Hibiscus sabdariffa]|uniref:Uncharacterized protein n=1 Tax=Hibiscus sabdariffa TaxID=183260 RepID=A0ABR2TFE6_9ROSI